MATITRTTTTTISRQCPALISSIIEGEAWGWWGEADCSCNHSNFRIAALGSEEAMGAVPSHKYSEVTVASEIFDRILVLA
jgi:hypothetical protein